MFKKIIISILFGICFLYILFCMALHTPLFGSNEAKKVPKDISHRWFWVVSLYIGDISLIVFLIFTVASIFYAFIFKDF